MLLWSNETHFLTTKELLQEKEGGRSREEDVKSRVTKVMASICTCNLPLYIFLKKKNNNNDSSLFCYGSRMFFSFCVCVSLNCCGRLTV